jgi:hypothetical protein
MVEPEIVHTPVVVEVNVTDNDELAVGETNWSLPPTVI